MTTAKATHASTSTLLASAPSTAYTTVEGNIYFPPSSLSAQSKLEVSDTHTTCSWKGVASYYNLVLEDGTKVKDIAWFYPEAKTGKAKEIEGFVAFDKRKVDVETEG